MQRSHRRHGRWPAHVAASLVIVAAAAATGAPVSAAPAGGTLSTVAAPDAIENSYIVVFTPGTLARSATGATAQRLAASQDGRVGHVYTTALQGFEVSLDEAAARRLAADPAVAYVEQNAAMRFAQFGGTQVNPPNRGLDRIDQPTWPLNSSYTYPTFADDIRAYVLDSGIRATHIDFGRVAPGVDLVDGGPGTEDCIGHGTHTAGIIGGTRYGVAKGVTLVPVRLGHCEQTVETAKVIAAIDWVTADHQPGQRAVANLSVVGPPSQAISTALSRSVGDGVVYTVAAGNNAGNACAFSPGNATSAVTVAATDFNGSDRVWPNTNLGSCVDVFAPGRIISSTWHISDVASREASGTSVSSAFAAGVAAIYWSLLPSLSVWQVTELVTQAASHGVVPNSMVEPVNLNLSATPKHHVFVQPIAVRPLPIGLWDVGDRITNYQVTAAGGTAPYTWSASGLPAGFTLDPTTGLLTGTFTTRGSWTVTVTVTDAQGRTGKVTATWEARRDVCPTC